MTDPASVASGAAETGARSTAGATTRVTARTAALRQLGTAARKHWIFLSVDAFLIAVIQALEAFDPDEVNKAIDDWDEAAKLLGDDQFGKALAKVVPDKADWDFTDREAFDTFLERLQEEIGDLRAVCEKNRDALTSARDSYFAAVDSFVDTLVPVLIAVAIAALLLAIPAANAFAVQVGWAGATVTLVVCAMLWDQLAGFWNAVAGVFRAGENVAFATDTAPGWAKDGADPAIKDIAIDWVLDDKAYRK